MQDMDDYDRRAGRTRHFDPSEFRYPPSKMTPDELRAYQAQFDAEIAQRQAPEPASDWLGRWGIPLMLFGGIGLWALAAKWLLS